jgi:hypothetical protein
MTDGCCSKCAQELVISANHDRMAAIPLLSLRSLLQDQFRLVQGQLPLFDFNSPTNKLLVVLDEVQTLSDHGMECFLSRADPRDIISIHRGREHKNKKTLLQEQVRKSLFEFD